MADRSGGVSASQITSALVGAVVAVALILLIAQNSESQEVEWLMFSGEAPVWILMLISAVAGAILVPLVAAMFRSRR